MPAFTPMNPATPLPAPGAGTEHALLDLKKGLSAKDFHNAKDVAAFANNLGGTLLVGAEEDGAARVLRYHPFSATDVTRLEEQITRAVDARCRPKPLVDFARIPHGQGFVLAVNVWPSIAAPIGVSVKADGVDGFGGTAWVFPVRIANQSIWLDSDNLPMHMLPALRRTLILLSSIPAGEPVALVRRGHTVTVHTIKEIDETTNTLRLSGSSPGHQEKWLPLDAIKHVYKGNADNGAAWQLGVVDPY